MTDTRYGYFIEREKYGLADHIYGHRFWDAQSPAEYLLEFLCVLMGTGYQLGRHTDLTDTSAETEKSVEYRRESRLGLRRFVFYADERKSLDDRDTEALRRLEDRLRAKISAEPTGHDALGPLRAFLRSFSAVERTRSWYAKSLFPVHQSFLFWEGLRPNAGKSSEGKANVKTMSSRELDSGFSVGARNFFARGGEMVYLMLGAGTLHDNQRRQFIQRRLEELLRQDSKVGDLAALVESTWQEEVGRVAVLGASEESTAAESQSEFMERTGTLGWLPDKDFPTYGVFAEDVEALLRCSLDPVEMFHLLSHLISFHVILYLYARAYSLCDESGIGGQPPSTILIDAVDVGEDRAIRYASSLLYKRNQEMLIRAGQVYADRLAKQHASSHDPLAAVLEHFFPTAGKKGHVIEKIIDRQQTRIAGIAASGNHNALVAALTNAVEDVFKDQFHKRFVPVHRRLAKEIGLVAPKTGTSQRYVAGDALMKALVLANVTAVDQEFHKFVNLLYTRYGLVIGPEQAARAPWLRDYDINNQYYQANMDAFRQKLKNSGLLSEYSDATALVQNRSAQVKDEGGDGDA